MPRVKEILKNITSIYDDFIETDVLAFLAEKRQEQAAAWNAHEKEIQLMKTSLQKRKGKICPSCYKPSSEVSFYKNNLRPDGLQVYCVNCLKNKVAHAQKRTLEILPEV